MKKHLIILIFLGCILPVSGQKSTNVPVGPVRTNHEWKHAEWLSDQVYDSSDDTFWLVYYKNCFVEHRNRAGDIIPGGFSYQKAYVEGIAFSPHDNSFWLSSLTTDSIYHYNSAGMKLDDGFPVKLSVLKTGFRGMLGITYDTSDSTLWLIETYARRITHYTCKGVEIGNGFDVLKVGANNGRGLVFDPRDESLWICNAYPNRLIHIDKQGNELSGSYYFNEKLSLADGVALDLKGFEFWISDYGPAQKR
jgi:hypothetical protein